MEIQTISTTLSIALAIVMLGLGLHLTVADFQRVLKYPKAAVIGLTFQLIVLPLVAFGVVTLFHIEGFLACGLMLLAASPGGITANLYSHLAGGDVALNITLTAINSLLCLISLPLIVTLSLSYFLHASQQVPIPTSKVVGTFSVVIIPVVLGMLLRHWRPNFADRLNRPVKIFSVVVLFLAIAASLFSERERLAENIKLIGFAVLLFNVISLLSGYFVPLLLGVERKQSIAVGMEIGIHNGTLAIAVATNLSKDSITFAMPAAIYSIFMFITAGIFAYLLTRRQKVS